MPFHIQEFAITPRYVSQLHTHDFHEFFMVTAGTVRHTLNGRSYDTAQNSLVRIRPDDEHCLGPAGSEPHVVNVAFTAQELQRAQAYLGIPHDAPPAAAIRLHARSVSSIRDVVTAARQPHMSPALRITLCRQLLTMLLSSAHAYGPDRDTALPSWLASAVHAMDDPAHYRQGIAEFIRLAGCSQEHLTRSLRKHLDTTPTAFINERKTRDAAGLLETTDRQVLEIAYETGFNNLSHFTTVFKKTYGTTPTGYRRMRRRIINA